MDRFIKLCLIIFIYSYELFQLIIYYWKFKIVLLLLQVYKKGEIYGNY